MDELFLLGLFGSVKHVYLFLLAKSPCRFCFFAACWRRIPCVDHKSERFSITSSPVSSQGQAHAVHSMAACPQPTNVQVQLQHSFDDRFRFGEFGSSRHSTRTSRCNLGHTAASQRRTFIDRLTQFGSRYLRRPSETREQSSHVFESDSPL